MIMMRCQILGTLLYTVLISKNTGREAVLPCECWVSSSPTLGIEEKQELALCLKEEKKKTKTIITAGHRKVLGQKAVPVKHVLGFNNQN